jgi:ADP-ribose pyrophosphatase YjhB (NUDIX family)
MKKLLGIILGLLLLTACQETLEQRCAREAKEYSQKNCPAPVGKDVTIDSLTFDMATHTLTYSYTLNGVIDDPSVILRNNPREQMLTQLKNATAMKPYKDAGYNFRYIYYSTKNKGTKLFEATFHKSDYR